MNDEQRAALVEELEDNVCVLLATAVGLARRLGNDFDPIKTGSVIANNAVMPIIDRLLAATPEPGLDELLDSVHPQAAITRMDRDSWHKWHITIQWVTVPDTSPVLHTFIGTGPTRMAALRDAVARSAKGARDE